MPLTPEKVICRRAFKELKKGYIVNLGVGIPMGVAKVAWEEGMLKDITLTTEIGVVGGPPQAARTGPPRILPQSWHKPPCSISMTAADSTPPVSAWHRSITRQRKRQQTGRQCHRQRRLHQHHAKRRGSPVLRNSSAVGTDIAAEEGKLGYSHGRCAVNSLEKVNQITFSGRIARRRTQSPVHHRALRVQTGQGRPDAY